MDYKHGKGVEVSAVENPQMMLYALGALELFDGIYDIDTVRMTIFQPRRGKRLMPPYLSNPFTISNRGILILGQQYGKIRGLPGSHAEDLAQAGIKNGFDDFVRGWVGTGKNYPAGIIHFAPNVDAQNISLFNPGPSAMCEFLWIRRVILGLSMPQLVIFAAFIRNQLFMAALLHDLSFIEYGDRVAEPGRDAFISLRSIRRIRLGFIRFSASAHDSREGLNRSLLQFSSRKAYTSYSLGSAPKTILQT